MLKIKKIVNYFIIKLNIIVKYFIIFLLFYLTLLLFWILGIFNKIELINILKFDFISTFNIFNEIFFTVLFQIIFGAVAIYIWKRSKIDLEINHRFKQRIYQNEIYPNFLLTINNFIKSSKFIFFTKNNFNKEEIIRILDEFKKEIIDYFFFEKKDLLEIDKQNREYILKLKKIIIALLNWEIIKYNYNIDNNSFELIYFKILDLSFLNSEINLFDFINEFVNNNEDIKNSEIYFIIEELIDKKVIYKYKNDKGDFQICINNFYKLKINKWEV